MLSSISIDVAHFSATEIERVVPIPKLQRVWFTDERILLKLIQEANIISP